MYDININDVVVEKKYKFKVLKICKVIKWCILFVYGEKKIV